MPFLRVIHDKRGYETTYLMHLYRDGARQRTRILYVFRSPGGARVGRTALDPDVLREIEARHPDIAFDWKDIREQQQHIEVFAEPRRRKPQKTDTPSAEPAEPISQPAPPPAVVEDAAATASPALPQVPSAIQGATPDDQIAFLAEWYPRIRDRVPARTADPVRRDALLALAERLNPAAWTDADQIAAGLLQAAEALERLSRVFSRRRRRARRRPGESRPNQPTAQPTES